MRDEGSDAVEVLWAAEAGGGDFVGHFASGPASVVTSGILHSSQG